MERKVVLAGVVEIGVAWLVLEAMASCSLQVEILYGSLTGTPRGKPAVGRAACWAGWTGGYQVCTVTAQSG